MRQAGAGDGSENVGAGVQYGCPIPPRVTCVTCVTCTSSAPAAMNSATSDGIALPVTPKMRPR